MQIWEPQATIRLYRVPWDSNYNDVVEFDSESARDAWFASQPCYELPVNASVYCYPNKPINIDVPYTTAYTYNYVVVSNPERETSPTTPAQKFFYFITSCTQSAPQPTLIGLQQDVWTQYLYQSEFGVGYYEQGHLPFVNTPCLSSDNIPATLARYFATDEGLNNGDTFIPYRQDVYSLQSLTAASAGDEEAEYPQADWMVITSTADLSANPGNLASPILTMAQGGFAAGVYSACNVYAIRTSSHSSGSSSKFAVDYLEKLSEYSWVAQCIVSITMVPYRMLEQTALKVTPVNLLGDSGYPMYEFNSDTLPASERQVIGSINITHVTNEGWDGVEQYQDVRKLWCYPYSAVAMSNGKNTLVLKPQYLPQNETPMRLFACAVSPFLEAAVVPWGYGKPNAGEFTVSYSVPATELIDSGSSETSDGGIYNIHTASLPYGDLLDTALWFTEFPQWSILNNNAVLYMAQNANTIQSNYSAAIVNYQTASMANDVSMQNAQASYATEVANAQNTYQAEMMSATVQGIGTIAGGGVKGGIVGAATGLAYGVTNVSATGYTAGAAAVNAERSAQTNLENQGRNYELANATNALNYAQSIKALEAGIADAQLVPPSSIGNVGGQGMRYINGLTYSIFVKYLRINPAYVAKLGDYFKRWGYLVDRYIDVPSDLRLCTPCTYWKFAEIYLECAEADETAKNALRGIMLKGTTVWTSPTAIGNTKPTDVTPITSRIATYYT